MLAIILIVSALFGVYSDSNDLQSDKEMNRDVQIRDVGTCSRDGSNERRSI